MSLPASLRQQLVADYSAVSVLPSPWARALWVTPLALLALVAAPLWFNVRVDAPRLGLLGLWGASALQTALGVMVVAAALRESVPGRSWSRAAIGLWTLIPIAIVVVVVLEVLKLLGEIGIEFARAGAIEDAEAIMSRHPLSVIKERLQAEIRRQRPGGS